MLCIGIFVLFVKLIIPKNSLKSYIYSLIGIITIITVISPVVKIIKTDDIKSSLNEVLNNISEDAFSSSDVSKYQDVNNEIIKEEVIDKLCEDIKTKVEEKGFVIKEVEVKLDDEYNIEKVEILMGSASFDESSIFALLKDEYEVEASKVNVRGE